MAFPWWFLPLWIDLTGFSVLTLSPEHLSAKKFCGLAHCWQSLTKQCTGRALLHVNLSCIHIWDMWKVFGVDSLLRPWAIDFRLPPLEKTAQPPAPLIYSIPEFHSWLVVTHPVTRVHMLRDAGKRRMILSHTHYLMMLSSTISLPSSPKSVAVLMYSCRSFLNYPFKFSALSSSALSGTEIRRVACTQER